MTLGVHFSRDGQHEQRQSKRQNAPTLGTLAFQAELAEPLLQIRHSHGSGSSTDNGTRNGVLVALAMVKGSRRVSGIDTCSGSCNGGVSGAGSSKSSCSEIGGGGRSGNAGGDDNGSGGGRSQGAGFGNGSTGG